MLNELKTGELATITLSDFKIQQSFYLVYPKQSKPKKEVDCMLEIFSPSDPTDCEENPPT